MGSNIWSTGKCTQRSREWKSVDKEVLGEGVLDSTNCIWTRKDVGNETSSCFTASHA